jgi:hypothetical protein
LLIDNLSVVPWRRGSFRATTPFDHHFIYTAQTTKKIHIYRSNNIALLSWLRTIGNTSEDAKRKDKIFAKQQGGWWIHYEGLSRGKWR